MNSKTFENLLKNIPSLEVSLNWCHNEAQGNFEKEFKHESIIVFTSFSCYQTGTFDRGDYFTPPTFSESELSVDDIELNVYDENGDELKLSKEQQELLSKEIQSSIISN